MNQEINHQIHSMTIRPMSCIFKQWLRVVGFMILAGWSTKGRAEEPVDEPVARLFSNRSVSQWHDLIRNIDPKTAGAARFVDPLIEMVADDNLPSLDRRQFAMFLARIGEPARKVVPILASLIRRKHQDPNLNYQWAVRAMALMGKPAKEATPELVDLLFDQKISVIYRQSSVEALARIGTDHPDAVPALLRLLQSKKSSQTSASDAASLRQLAAESFAIVGPGAEIAAPILIRVVRDPSERETVRRNAIIALGTFGRQGSVAVHAICEELVAGESAAIRDVAAEALVKIGQSALPQTISFLHHQDPEVRWRIALNVQQLTEKSAKQVVQPELVVSLKDEQNIVRICASESYWKLFGASDRVVDCAIDLLSDHDRTIRIRAKNLLVAMKPLKEQHLAKLRKVMVEGPMHAVKSAKVTLQLLLREN